MDDYQKKNDEWFKKKRLEAQVKADQAYNEGLWESVKWNPFKWWVYFLYAKKIPRRG